MIRDNSIKGLPAGLKKAAKKALLVEEMTQPIAEDYASGDMGKWFNNHELEELKFGEADILKFQQTKLFEKIRDIYHRRMLEENFEDNMERMKLGLPLKTMTEADGDHWGIATKKFFDQYIPVKVYSRMIETLYERRMADELVTLKLNLTKEKHFEFNVQGDRMKAVVIDELTPIPTQAVTFTKILVRPYTIGLGFNLSDEAVEDANINVVQLMLKEVAWALAEKIDNDIMACLIAGAGSTPTTSTFGAAQWTADMQTIEDNLYIPSIAVMGNTVATYFRQQNDFTDGTNYHAAPQILADMMSRGWIGSYYNVPIRRLHTSRIATDKVLMLDNVTEVNPVSALVTKRGIKFDTERTAAYRATATFSHLSYAPAVLNGDGIVYDSYTG